MLLDSTSQKKLAMNLMDDGAGFNIQNLGPKSVMTTTT
jgi:hypothetical protein